jgi:hypothetical protein
MRTIVVEVLIKTAQSLHFLSTYFSAPTSVHTQQSTEIQQTQEESRLFILYHRREREHSMACDIENTSGDGDTREHHNANARAEQIEMGTR